jgi:hypothetical protein
MNPNLRKALFVAIPVAGALLLAAVLWFRAGSQLPHESKKQPVKNPYPVYEVARSAPPPKPAPPEKIAKATESVRIRGTYQNYRRAVATNDEGLQKILLPILKKDGDAARECAEQDLSIAQTEFDRAVARRVIDDLRR